MLPRRSFLGWIGTALAAFASRRRAGAQPPPSSTAVSTPSSQGSGLDIATLTRLGQAMLPSELGDQGVARVCRAFAQWVSGYRQGAELVHPYGSHTIRFNGESPVARWRQQLAALDRDARAKHRRSFGSLTPDERRAIVAGTVSGERLERLPSALGANHVAIALIAWFYDSPEATDLCYRARIDTNQCRPLVNSPRQPLPLAPSRTGGGGGATRDADWGGS